MFARYVEIRPTIEKVAKKTKDPADIVLAKYFDITKKKNNLKSGYSHKWYELDRKREEAWLAIFPVIDIHPDWIYSFMSPFGEAYVRTVDEAVSICERVEAYKFKGEKLNKWREQKRRLILTCLSPIKLGIGGGSLKL